VKRQGGEIDKSQVLARIEQFHNVSEVLYDAAVEMELMLGTLPVPNYYFDNAGKFRLEEFNVNPPRLGVIHHPTVGKKIYSVRDARRLGLNLFSAEPIYLTTAEIDLCASGMVHIGIAEERTGGPVDATDPFDGSQRIWGLAVNRWGYFFSSVGPDGVRDIYHVSGHEDFMDKINLFYDPTNGIMSGGDLISHWDFGEEAD